MDHLIVELLLIELGSLSTAARACEESIEQVLLLRVELSHAHVNHIAVVNVQLIELSSVSLKQLLAEKQFLLLDVDGALDRDEALQILHGAVVLALYIVELVIEAQVLDHKTYHCVRLVLYHISLCLFLTAFFRSEINF